MGNLFKMMIIPFLVNLFSNAYPIETEPNINLNAYIGNWFQVATSRSTRLLGTGVNYTNVSAIYGITYNANLDQNVLDVYNKGIDEYGNYSEIKGYSYITGDSDTKRKVQFVDVPVDGNYWILKLGPILSDKYQYSIVGGPITDYIGTRFALYVLARDRDNYKISYESEVKKWCSDNGFNMYWNEYIPTP
jgi:lipocalin